MINRLSQPRSRVGFLLLLLLFCIGPALYWVHLVAVVIHELVGHGLVALALGGEFRGFMIAPDGFGWAYAYVLPDTAGYAWKHSALLAGGSTSTWLTGVLVALALIKLRQLPSPVRLTGVLFAYALLTEGASYLLFTSIVPTGGDWAEVMRLWGNPVWLRVVFVVCGLCMLLLSIGWCLHHGLKEWAALLAARGIDKRYWVAVLGIVVAFPSFLFDWDQLAPGLWQWPNLAMLLIHAVLSIEIARRGFASTAEKLERLAMARSWLIIGVFNALFSVVVLLLCWMVLRHEVVWG